MTEEEAICQRIKSAREHAGMTQADTASALGVTLRAYQYYEKNRVPWMRLEDLADILEVTRKWLIHGDPVENTDLAELRQEVAELREQVAKLLMQ